MGGELGRKPLFYNLCLRPGCGKPTWKGTPSEFCSTACGTVTCVWPGCCKPTWNGQPNNYCSWNVLATHLAPKNSCEAKSVSPPLSPSNLNFLLPPERSSEQEVERVMAGENIIQQAHDAVQNNAA